MIVDFGLAIIGYFGVIAMQRRWYRRAVLSEGRFVLFQVPILSLIILIGFLAFSNTIKGIVMGSVLSLVCTILGNPIARKIYRRHFAQSNS